MLSKEEIEKARDNVFRGNDIESAAIILKAMILDGWKEIGGRVNTLKVATIQILDFIEEYKNKSYLDVVREKVKANAEIKKLETKQQKLIEKLEEKIQLVKKCYQDLVKPYYDEKLNIINTSFMSKKEKEEFINKRNCLLVQKHCYNEILEIMKGESNE